MCRYWCIAILAMIWLNLSWASTPPWQLLVEQLQSLHAFKASFKQIVITGDQQQKSNGKFYWQPPDQFKCIISGESPQQIVSNGQTLWTYDIALEQVMVKSPLKHDDLTGLPALMFNVQQPDKLKAYPTTLVGNNDQLHFQIKPNQQSAEFQQLDLFFQTNMLQRVIIRDLSGQRIDVRFSNIKIDQTQPKSFFVLHIPKGVDVVQAQ